MDGIVSEEKKLSTAWAEEFTRSVSHNRKAESKSNSQVDDQPSGKPEYISRRSRSFRKRSNFGRVGFRKQDVTRAVSVGNGSRLHRRARTMHLSHVLDLPASPAADVGIDTDTVAVMEEFRSLLSGLSGQLTQVEKRLDKQLGAYHKRFEKMEQMQLKILANIRNLAKANEKNVKKIRKDALSRGSPQDLLSDQFI